MMLIKLTRTADGKTIYVNPQTINAIYPDYNSGVTIIQFVDEDNFLEVEQSVCDVAKMVERKA